MIAAHGSTHLAQKGPDNMKICIERFINSRKRQRHQRPAEVDSLRRRTDQYDSNAIHRARISKNDLVRKESKERLRMCAAMLRTAPNHYLEILSKYSQKWNEDAFCTALTIGNGTYHIPLKQYKAHFNAKTSVRSCYTYLGKVARSNNGH